MIIIGHRGARGLAPENTIASLRKALAHNVDEIEFDVRVTSDGVVIMVHDSHLKDQAGNHLSVHSHSYEELLEHKSDLATLQMVFDEMGPSTPLYIDVKPGVSVGPIIEAINYALQNGFTANDLRVGSYSQAILREIHATFPAITMVVIERWSGVRAVYRARQLGTRRIALGQRWLWWGYVGPTSRRGWQLTPYPLNSTKKAKGWQRLGLYGLVTDYPDRFEN